jgi:hemerythrin
MIKWEESYSTGVEKLDNQHKSLFQFCNDIEGIINDGGISKEFMVSALKYLDQYVKVHFGQEETCMHKHACPIAGTNKIAHEKFIEAFHKFQSRLNEKGDTDGCLEELHHFLETWLVEHICKIDTKLKACVHK